MIDKKIIWEHVTGSNKIVGMASQGQKIILCSNSGWITAVDITSGEACWSKELNSFVKFSPVVTENTVVVAANKDLVFINAQDGSLISQIPTGKTISSMPAVSDGFICFGTEEGTLHYRRMESKEDLWVYYSTDTFTSPPLMTKDLVYVVDGRGRLCAVLR